MVVGLANPKPVSHPGVKDQIILHRRGRKETLKAGSIDHQDLNVKANSLPQGHARKLV